MRSVAPWAMSLLLPVALVALWGCEDDDEAATNVPPVALAEGDTLVARSTQITLLGSASSDPDGAIARYEWLIEGQPAAWVVPGGDTVILAPPTCDPDFLCVLRVIDDAGAVAYDTLHVRVLGNCAPTAVASGDAAVAPESLFSIRALATDPEDPAPLIEWSLGGAPFVRVSIADTSAVAPGTFSMNYQCILRVTDDSGAVALDTHHVIVSWVRSPNGGESFTVGDTLRVHLFAINTLVGLKLIIQRYGDQMDFSLGAGTGSFSPADNPDLALAIPDTIYDDFFGAVSTVSDSCRIRVFLYMNSETYVESAGMFRILPRP